MPYAANPARPQSARSNPAAAGGEGARRDAMRDRHTPGAALDDDRDWMRLGVFGAGLALGALIGASAALLYAPQSGAETRVRLARGARGMSWRAADRWEELGDELRHAARRGKRRVRRTVRRSRWAAADALDE